jgi:hypothetical protein
MSFSSISWSSLMAARPKDWACSVLIEPPALMHGLQPSKRGVARMIGTPITVSPATAWWQQTYST